MRKRDIYSILFGVPGFSISLMISFIIFGMMTGVLWLYFFGDNPWPLNIEKVLFPLFALIFFFLWLAIITVGYIIGNNLEHDSSVSKIHIMASFLLTLSPLILIIIHQLILGNIGSQSDSVLCSRFCNQNGYSASGTSPENSGQEICLCFDESGNEALQVSLHEIDRGK